MGYPNKRIAMTDVHGEPQQGGYLPAEIWHAYMAAVTEGQPCAALNESNQGISFRPFYGKYATTGLAHGFGESTGEEPAGATKPSGHKPAPEHQNAPAQTPGEPRQTPGEPQRAPSEAPTATPVPPAAAPAPQAPPVNRAGGATP